jgi:hypothetical protein
LVIELAYIVLGGLMCRADGWGAEAYPDSKLVELLTDFWGMWTTGLAMGLAVLYAGWPIALVVALGWVLWRGPHLGSYWVPGNEHKMFLRATLTIAPMVAGLIYLTESNWWLLALIAAHGVVQVLAYNGMQRTSYKHKHVVSEWVSGMSFAAVVMLVI